MYEPVTRCVARHLTLKRTPSHPGINLLDTHTQCYLDGQARDITITIQDVDAVDCASVVAIIQLKPSRLIPMDSDSFGQVYGYLRKLPHENPSRRTIVGLLSNLTFNHIIIYSSPGHGVVHITHFASAGFASTLRFLKHCILKDPVLDIIFTRSRTSRTAVGTPGSVGDRCIF